MRAISLAALLYLVGSPVAAQAVGDSVVVASHPDRYVIDAAKLVREGGARSLTDVLISQVPGLLVTPGPGLTGGGARIRFAGLRSLVDDAAPVILVDGVRIDATEDASLFGSSTLRLDDLAVEDIESAEVIRGPASGAVYGPGAMAGVILIRTKNGASGPLRWDVHAQSALRVAPSRWPANYGGVDADHPSIEMRRGGCTLTAQAAGSCVQDFVQAFNPLVERNPFATALRRQVGFSGSGGPRWGAFRVAGGFERDGAVYGAPGAPSGDDYKRWHIRATGAIQPVPWLDVRASVAATSSDLRLQTDLVRGALRGPSDSTGFTWAPWFGPSAMQAVDRASAVVQVRARALPWLALDGLLGIDDVDQREVGVNPGSSRSDGDREAEHRVAALRASAEGITWRGLRFTTTVGIERLSRRLALAASFRQPDTGTCSLCVFQSSSSPLHSVGVYAVEQVALRERVFVTGAVRHDGFDEYSRNSTTHPSLAVAWIARPERTGAVGRLELRAAYGSAGRPFPPGLEEFPVSPGPIVPSTSFLRPERTRAFEVGADARLLDGRWHARVTVYDLRSDAINFGLAPSSTGFVRTYANGAVIRNRGIVATVSGTSVDRPGGGWDLRISVWGNRNRLERSLGAPVFFDFASSFTGQRLVAGYPVAGYWATPIPSYDDANGDGIIVPSEVVLSNTFAWVGTPYPTQGAVLTSTWRVTRRWRLAVTLDYRAGHTLFNGAARSRCAPFSAAVCRERHDPATPLSDQAMAVAASLGAAPPVYFEDADYLKVREVGLTFDVPPGAAASLGARSATVSLTGRNLLTWTGYSGADPEAGSYGAANPGQPPTIVDTGTVPVPRVWVLQVRLTY